MYKFFIKIRNINNSSLTSTCITSKDMFKVRIVNLDAVKARNVIDTLRSNEGMAPGLLKSGRWVNADSI